MGIVKKVAYDYDDYTPFQEGVLEILDEYDYEILDLRYIEEYQQVVATLKGLVMFITPEDVSLAFEISQTPVKVANLTLILAERIDTKHIHLTDSFIITKDSNGNNIAVFGPDAEEIYKVDLAKQAYDPKYLAILVSPNVKFYKC